MSSTVYLHISPFVIVTGTFSFMVSFLFHVAVWRAKRPRNQIAMLAAIFVFAPLCAFGALFILSHSSQSPTIWFVRDIFNIACVYIWHLSLSGIYVMSYPAIQASSPSLVIVCAVADNEPEGMELRKIHELFPADALYRDRFNDLHADNLITHMDGQTVPTLKGQFLRAIFIGYRKLLDLPVGEG